MNEISVSHHDLLPILYFYLWFSNQDPRYGTNHSRWHKICKRAWMCYYAAMNDFCLIYKRRNPLLKISISVLFSWATTFSPQSTSHFINIWAKLVFENLYNMKFSIFTGALALFTGVQTAALEQRANPWSARHGLTSSAYQTVFNDLTSQVCII